MDSYAVFKTIHLFGVVVFLGNIIVTGWWKVMADRHGDARVVAFAQRQVTLTDFVFTAGGVALLLLGGLGNAMNGPMDYSFLDTAWLAWGFWAFCASGVIWVLFLIPIQIRQARMARNFADGGVVPEAYRRLSRQWITLGGLATFLPLASMVLMVLKPV